MSIEIGRIRNALERHIYGRTRQNAGWGRYLAVSFLVLSALAFCRLGAPAYAQGVTATPLPRVVATQQAANAAAAQVNDLQAQRAQTEEKLAEINRNIEAQIAEAERAAADARAAAAAQNAVESGAAIGRLEGVLAQLRASYAGKDDIIGYLTARMERQAAQSADDKRAIDRLTLQLQQANTDKRTAVSAYNAIVSQQQTRQASDATGNAVSLIVSLAFLLAVIAFSAYVVQRRRAVPPIITATATVIDVEAAEEEAGRGATEKAPIDFQT